MTERNQKALVVLSGGQDSTTCLYWAKAMYDEVHAVTFNYGQRHAIELEAATKVAEMAGVRTHEVVDIGPILKGTSPLVSDEELEQYPDGELPDGLEKTFVPMRNQLFLTIAANRAYVLGCGTLVTGVCEADNGGYPDCRQEFINAMEMACYKGTFTGEDGAPGPLIIKTPLMHQSKAESVRFAITLGAYHALAYSHTAYDGQYPPLGHDHATVLRAKGFREAGWPDPLILRAVAEKKMEMPVGPEYAAGRVATACEMLADQGATFV